MSWSQHPFTLLCHIRDRWKRDIFSIDPTRRALLYHGLFRARHEGGEGGEGGLPDEEEGVVVVDDDDDGERRGGRGGRVHLERASDVGTHEEHDFVVVVIIIIIIILVDDDDDDDAVENVERSVDENERSGRFSLGRKSVESDERIKRRDS